MNNETTSNSDFKQKTLGGSEQFYNSGWNDAIDFFIDIVNRSPFERDTKDSFDVYLNNLKKLD